ncbi:MAG: hypothetical protein FWD47_08450 [Treponema sp.]|nr:hypothetical protein [Treponema sp.]
MNKKEKTLVINALTYKESPSYWGVNNVKNYLRELQNKFNEVLITATSEELRNRIFQWIDKCDPELDVFYNYNKTIEQEKGKTCQLFQIPSNLVNEINNVLSKQEELPYDALNMGTWDKPKLVFSCKKGNQFEMWYAVKATKHASKAFNFDKLPEDIQNSLFSVLADTIPDMYELEKIRFEYNIFNRIINILTIDTLNKKISISTDQPKLTDPDDAEKSNVRPEDRLSPLFDRIFNSLGISNTTTKNISEKRRVNINSVKQIKVKETDKLLLFPNRFDTSFNAGDLTAANITKFPRLTTNNIFPTVEEYYQTNKTFKNFFNTYSNFDAHKNSTLLLTIKDVPGIETEAEGFFLFVVVDSFIHVARILCNITTGSLRIFLEKGNGSYEYIASELDRIFS